MTAIFYLLLGLALMGGLYWVLMQITARQRRLGAELTRLERLAAEVSMSAESVLDQVDERVDRLNELMARAEATVAAAQATAAVHTAAPASAAPAPAAKATAPAPAPAGAQAAAPQAPAPAEAAAAPRKRGRPRKSAPSEPAVTAAAATAAAAIVSATAPLPGVTFEPGSAQPDPAPYTPAAVANRRKSALEAPALESAPAPDSAAAQPPSMERYQNLRPAVWNLADQGKDAVEIAQELNLPRGEVQLLLNLRSKKVTA